MRYFLITNSSGFDVVIHIKNVINLVALAGFCESLRIHALALVR